MPLPLQHGLYEVSGARQAILLKDDTVCVFHEVRHQGVPSTFLRACQPLPGHWVIFDLRRLARTLDIDFRSLHARDHPGVVLYTVRALFGTASELEAAATAQAIEAWYDAEADHQLHLFAA